MLPKEYRLVCPTDPNHELFSAVAHTTEEWEVDNQGDFVKVMQSIDTTHAPDLDDQFLCRSCGAEAKKVRVADVERAELASVTFNFRDHRSVTIPAGRGILVVPETIRWTCLVGGRFSFEWESEVKKNGT